MQADLVNVCKYNAETQQGIFYNVFKVVVDFDSEPWPVISDSAKDLITRMLNPWQNMKFYVSLFLYFVLLVSMHSFTLTYLQPLGKK